MTRCTGIIISLISIAGCSAPKGRGIIDDDASFKIPAIKSAVDQQDEKAIPQLVADLESDDAAVRFYAIEGLRRLTGETFGYQFYDSLADRRMAVERWKMWLVTQE